MDQLSRDYMELGYRATEEIWNENDGNGRRYFILDRAYAAKYLARRKYWDPRYRNG